MMADMMKSKSRRSSRSGTDAGGAGWVDVAFKEPVETADSGSFVGRGGAGCAAILPSPHFYPAGPSWTAARAPLIGTLLPASMRESLHGVEERHEECDATSTAKRRGHMMLSATVGQHGMSRSGLNSEVGPQRGSGFGSDRCERGQNERLWSFSVSFMRLER
jgi:hypothetical protein